MPDSISPSMKPPQSSGGAIYVIAVIALVAAIGGLVCWKLKGSNDTPHPPVVVVPPSVTPPTIADPPPPPPPVVETAAPVDAGGPVKAAGGGGYSPCNKQCTGSAVGALSSALSARAGAARSCYEHALRANAQLQGKLMINVRVDPQGSVCAASVAQDAIHSPEISNCVLNMFRSAKFPAPQGGGCAEVNVPLAFVPREGK